MKISSSLLDTLRSIKGNQRACVVTEPLWAIPNNLILPFSSVYMAAIGLSDTQIGLVASLGLAAQFIAALLSGAIVDKHGRRATMLTFGLISWTIPCILWAAARDLRYFIFAAALNGLWRITGTSFNCMIVEDGDSDKLVNIYTILNIFGVAAGFISPAVGLCIKRFALAPTMRGIYVIATAMMTSKFIIQFMLVRESKTGLRRRAECGGHSLLSLAFGGWSVFVSALRDSKLIHYVIFVTLMNCFNIIQSAFWPLFVTDIYGIDASLISVFPMVKAIVMILAYLFITPHISIRSARRPLLHGLGLQLLGLGLLLLCIPFAKSSILAVFVSAICDAFAIAFLGPVSESIMSVAIPAQERARISSLITAAVLIISSPAGYIAGRLSQINRMLPLIMNLCLLAGELLMVLMIARISPQNPKAQG